MTDELEEIVKTIISNLTRPLNIQGEHWNSHQVIHALNELMRKVRSKTRKEDALIARNCKFFAEGDDAPFELSIEEAFIQQEITQAILKKEEKENG